MALNHETGLTDKQSRFVEEYLVDLCATKAALRAGYSAKTAEQQGYQLLQKTSVSKAIDAVTAGRSDRVQLTQDAVIKSLVRIADAAEASKNYTAALRALELLGKHLGMFTNKHEISGVNSRPLNVVIRNFELDA